MRRFFWRPKAHSLSYWYGKHHNFYAMKDCLTWPMWHTKMHISAKCNSGRIAIQWFLIKHFLDYQYTKLQPYTFPVQKMCVFAQYATLVPRLIKALCQSSHLVWGLAYRRTIKEETIAINRDWVYNQACRLLHDINVVSFYNHWYPKLGFPTIFLKL